MIGFLKSWAVIEIAGCFIALAWYIFKIIQLRMIEAEFNHLMNQNMIIAEFNRLLNESKGDK